MKPRVNFGWLPQIPDIRDIQLRTARMAGPVTLPPKIELFTPQNTPPVLDQGYLGSCVANAIATGIEFEVQKQHIKDGRIEFLESKRRFTPSRLFIYYGAREILGTIHEDSGAMIRDGMKVVYETGAPRETGWRYEVDKFTNKPPLRQYISAPFHKITGYRFVPTDVNSLKGAIAENRTVVIGISVYDSFYRNENGDVPMPGSRERLLGGHAILVTGYDDVTRMFTFRNSWGKEWGTNGNGRLLYSYITPYLAGDFWTVIDEHYKERMENT